MTESVADVVRVMFEATGQNELARAFESVEARMGRFEKTTSQSAASGVRERVASAKKERKEREATYAAMFKEIDKKEKDSAKSADKSARDRAKSEADAARSRLREEENLARSQQRIRENSARMAGQIAEKQANDEIRAARRVATEQERIQSRRVAGARRVGGAITGSVSRVLGGASMLVGGALAIGGGFSTADAIGGELNAQRQAYALSNSAYIKGGAGASGSRFDPMALLGKARGVQGITNISKSDVLAGMQSFVAKTGNAELLGADNSFVLDAAKLAKAEGASFADVMSAAGILRAQNPNLDPVQASQMLRNVVKQGQMGAVEMSDLAANAGKITASSAAYASDQATSQRKLLGLSQIVFPVAGSVEESATSITHLSDDVLKHYKNFASLGLKDAKTGRLKDSDEIITSILGATGGDMGKIIGMGVGERSKKIFQALAPAYQRDLDSATGTPEQRKAAAMKATRARIGQFTDATMDKGETEERFAAIMSQKAEKIDAAMTRLREILAEKGVPLFERFMAKLDENLPTIERNIGRLADLISWFADNPFKGLGALVLANVAKDIAGAAIGSAVKNAIVAALNGAQSAMRNPGALLPSGVGVPGNGGAIGAAAGAGILALAVTGALDVKTGIDSSTDARSRGQGQALGAASQLGNVQRLLAAGKISPADAKKALEQAQGLVDKGREGGTVSDIARASFVGGSALESIGLGGVVGSKEAQNKIGEAAGIRDSSKMLESAIKELTTALQGNSARVASNGNAANPSDPGRTQSHGTPRVAQ